MGVDQTSLDRIRNATFPTARRGYDKDEVEKFLGRLADWLETGAGDESRSDVVKRELEKVGERTGAILAQAEESAQQIRAEAEEEARGTVNAANMEAAETRTETERYESETRASADAYARRTREDVEQEAAASQAKAEEDARQTIAAAEAQARRIVEEGKQRREDIEAVIADLLRRRNDVLEDTEELSAKLTAAVSQHRDGAAIEAFPKPDELDPLARGDGVDEPAEDAEEPEPAEPTELVDAREPVQEPTAEHPGPEQEEADLRRG